MKQVHKEFWQFLQKQNIIALAIAVVIGNAAKELVTSIVNNLVMPIIGIFTPDGSWRKITITILGSDFGIGPFLGSTLDFLVVAVVVFIIAQKVLKIDKDSSKVKK